MRRYGILGLVLVVLAAVYGATLQTIPNGSDHYFMIDVGETQLVLNTWGTLHPTGYPHYVITGNLLTTLLKALGSDPTAAAALVSLLWGLLALSALYALALRLTGRPLAAGLTVLLYGLTRTVWIHHTIAEIYTFGLLLTALLYLIALWPLKNRFSGLR
jgi:4-amino-4-deoxy-L-arabinose transferase-like glycosyltransferase